MKCQGCWISGESRESANGGRRDAMVLWLLGKQPRNPNGYFHNLAQMAVKCVGQWLGGSPASCCKEERDGAAICSRSFHPSVLFLLCHPFIFRSAALDRMRMRWRRCRLVCSSATIWTPRLTLCAPSSTRFASASVSGRVALTTLVQMGIGMHGDLIDAEGFPRAGPFPRVTAAIIRRSETEVTGFSVSSPDIDVVRARVCRNRIYSLCNVACMPPISPTPAS
jgi:hypothetical protein